MCLPAYRRYIINLICDELNILTACAWWFQIAALLKKGKATENVRMRKEGIS